VTVIFFSNRVINIWNALPDTLPVNSFKSIAFISVIFVLIVLFDYIYSYIGPGYTVCLVFLCSFYVFIF